MVTAVCVNLSMGSMSPAVTTISWLKWCRKSLIAFIEKLVDEIPTENIILVLGNDHIHHLGAGKAVREQIGDLLMFSKYDKPLTTPSTILGTLQIASTVISKEYATAFSSQIILMTSTGDVDPLPLKKRINLIPRCKVHLFAFDDKPYYSEAVKSLEHWRRFCLRQRGSFFHVESCGKQHLRQIFNDLWDKHYQMEEQLIMFGNITMPVCFYPPISRLGVRKDPFYGPVMSIVSTIPNAIAHTFPFDLQLAVLPNNFLRQSDSGNDDNLNAFYKPLLEMLTMNEMTAVVILPSIGKLATMIPVPDKKAFLLRVHGQRVSNHVALVNGYFFRMPDNYCVTRKEAEDILEDFNQLTSKLTERDIPKLEKKIGDLIRLTILYQEQSWLTKAQTALLTVSGCIPPVAQFLNQKVGQMANALEALNSTELSSDSVFKSRNSSLSNLSSAVTEGGTPSLNDVRRERDTSRDGKKRLSGFHGTPSPPTHDTQSRMAQRQKRVADFDASDREREHDRNAKRVKMATQSPFGTPQRIPSQSVDDRNLNVRGSPSPTPPRPLNSGSRPMVAQGHPVVRPQNPAFGNVYTLQPSAMVAPMEQMQSSQRPPRPHPASSMSPHDPRTGLMAGGQQQQQLMQLQMLQRQLQFEQQLKQQQQQSPPHHQQQIQQQQQQQIPPAASQIQQALQGLPANIVSNLNDPAFVQTLMMQLQQMQQQSASAQPMPLPSLPPGSQPRPPPPPSSRGGK